MTTITAIVRGGRLEVTEPINLPDGTELRISLPVAPAGGSMSPDEIARVLAAMEQMIPFELSDAERSAWETEQQARQAREKAAFAAEGEHLRGMWDDPIPPR